MQWLVNGYLRSASVFIQRLQIFTHYPLPHPNTRSAIHDCLLLWVWPHQLKVPFRVAGSERCQQSPLLITQENKKWTSMLAIRKTKLVGECQPGNMKHRWYLDVDCCTEATDSYQKPFPHPFVLASKPQVPELSALAPGTRNSENIHDSPPGHVDSEGWLTSWSLSSVASWAQWSSMPAMRLVWVMLRSMSLTEAICWYGT